LLSIFLICGCSRADRSAETNSAPGGAPVAGDWVIVRYEAEPESLNPLISQTSYATYAMTGLNSSQIYETLMQYNTKDWTVTQPLLAESYPEVSGDHLTYTFTLRDGVRWHDGKPLTAEDVLFTFKAAVCALVDSAPIRSYLTDLRDVELLDGRRIRLTVSQPNVLNLQNLGNLFGIMPKHVFDSTGILDAFTFKDMIGVAGKSDAKIKKFAEQFNSHPANRVPIGTGPYTFEKWDTGRQIVLARNDNYWGPKAYLEKIVIRIIPDFPAALTALKAGEVDLNPRLLPIQYAQQTSGAAFEQQFEKTKYSLPNYTYIGWNLERPFFKDKRVRQALTMLVDRQQILETLRFGLGKVAGSHFTPQSRDFNPNIKLLPYDPKRAAELLTEAGWVDHDGDGIRDKDGVAFRFEFLGAANSTLTQQLMPILKEEFRKAGIEMTERQLEFTVLFENLKDHRFDATTLGWSSPLMSDPYQLWHSSSAANRGSNFVSFKNPEADRLLEQARVEFDLDKRRQLYWRWQEIIHDEQPYTFLFYPEDSAAYSKRFHNVTWLPPRPGYDLNSWFVSKAAQRYGTATVLP
jgi:peptide/nickel transport system substrate-binding protein